MVINMPASLNDIIDSIRVSLEARKEKKKKNWSKDVTEHEKWHPPEGLFKESPSSIASTLKKNSSSKAQAKSRLTFYMNRAGKNLSKADKERLEKAKKELDRLYDDDSAKKKPGSAKW